MKKTIIIIIVILLFSSCAKNQKQINIAIIGKVNDSYWNEVKLGAESAGKELGVNVKFYVPPKEDPAWQIRKLQEVISSPIDGVAIGASDPKTIEPTMVNIVQSNIPCITIDKDVAKARHAYIGTGNYYAGQQAGELMAETLEYNGNIAIITDPSIPDYVQRVQGFKDIINEHEKISVTSVVDINNNKIESLFDANNPSLNIKGIFCVSDDIGIATVKTIKKADKINQIKVICIGESPEVIKAVKENIIQIAISRRPFRVGYSCVLVLYDMIKVGVNNTLAILPKSEIIDPGIIIVTSSNVDEYREQLSKLGIKMRF
ncbi:MAG: substrate-binding domain-containing protein [Candidatus Poribacteria bacterium]